MLRGDLVQWYEGLYMLREFWYNGMEVLPCLGSFGIMVRKFVPC